MSTTIIEIQPITGQRFTAKLNRYVETSPATTYYVLETTSGAKFILAPVTSIDSNPLLWAAGYVAILDKIL